MQFSTIKSIQIPIDGVMTEVTRIVDATTMIELWKKGSNSGVDIFDPEIGYKGKKGPGRYVFYLNKGKYKIVSIGGGGAGLHAHEYYYSTGGGGSGACLIGKIYSDGNNYKLGVEVAGDGQDSSILGEHFECKTESGGDAYQYQQGSYEKISCGGGGQYKYSGEITVDLNNTSTGKSGKFYNNTSKFLSSAGGSYANTSYPYGGGYNDTYYGGTQYPPTSGYVRICRLIDINLSAQKNGSVSGGGEFEVGQNHEISAIPIPGYVFNGWSDGNYDKVRNLENVFQDINLTALFSDNIISFDSYKYFSNHYGSAVMNFLSGTYDFVVIGAGGQRRTDTHSFNQAGGGSGAALSGRMHLSVDTELSICLYNYGKRYLVSENKDSWIKDSTGQICLVAGAGSQAYKTTVASTGGQGGVIDVKKQKGYERLKTYNGYQGNASVYSEAAGGNYPMFTVVQDRKIKYPYGGGQGDLTDSYSPQYGYILIQKMVSVDLSASEGGNVSGGGEFIAGENCTISATPLENYIFHRWSDDTNLSSRTLTEISNDINLTAYFRFKDFFFDSEDGYEGTQGPGDYNILLRQGKYKIVTIGGGGNGGVPAQGWAGSGGSAPCLVLSTNIQKEYECLSINVGELQDNTTISSDTINIISLPGDSVRLGHYADKVLSSSCTFEGCENFGSLDGVEGVRTASYPPPASDIYRYGIGKPWQGSVENGKVYGYVRICKMIDINLTSSEYGVVSGGGANLECISTYVVSAIPDEGCEFTQWSDGNEESCRTFINPMYDINLSARFDQTVEKRGGRWVLRKSGGTSVYAYATWDEDKEYWNYYSDTKNVTISVDGRRYYGECVAGSTTYSGYSKSVNSDSFKLYNGEQYYEATYEHSVTLSSTPNNRGTVYGEGFYEVGKDCVISAVVKSTYASTYEFAKWSDGNTNSRRVFENLHQNIDLTAEFRGNRHNGIWGGVYNGEPLSVYPDGSEAWKDNYKVPPEIKIIKDNENGKFIGTMNYSETERLSGTSSFGYSVLNMYTQDKSKSCKFTYYPDL